MTDDDAKQLAEELRRWRGTATMRQAAACLGLKQRTYEGIEYGRGFPHPFLLRHAIRTIKVTNEND